MRPCCACLSISGSWTRRYMALSSSPRTVSFSRISQQCSRQKRRMVRVCPLMGLCFFHLQVVSWVLTSPLVQAPVLVRKSPSNTRPLIHKHALIHSGPLNTRLIETLSADFCPRCADVSGHRVHPGMFARRRRCGTSFLRSVNKPVKQERGKRNKAALQPETGRASEL